MFKKIPHGVKVRVRDSDETGYVAEYALYCSRFFPCLDTWTLIKCYTARKQGDNTFPTFELAQKAAMEQYDRWIEFYERKKEEEKRQKSLKKNLVIWKHP